MKCAECKEKPCETGRPCAEMPFPDLYGDPETRRTMRAASEVSGEFYGLLNRLEEIMEFAGRMGFRKLGLAFCIGLAEEARLVAEILGREFEVESVCCKLGGLENEELGLMDPPGPKESSCNPATQALMIERAGCELAIVLGLCVGHDTVFYRACRVPVTTLAVKDRVLGHNPIAAVTCPYVRKRVGKARNKP